MSNRNSSTRSRTQSTRRASSSKIGNNKNCSLKTCILSWNIDNLSELGWPSRKLSSPVYSSVDDDLKWHLEFSGHSGSPKFISIVLKLDHENGFFKKYNAISGDAELSVLMSSNGYGNVQNKIKKFEIQNTGNMKLPCIHFLEFVADHTNISGELKIDCIVTYVTTEKKIHVRENPFHKLSDDFENLLFNKQFGDAIIKVKDKEYPVYKGILAARSPVFERMFREDNGMLENTTNVVNISDLSPEIIEEMLLFVYTGKVKKLEKSVYELLPAANKYQLEDLMKICEDALFKQLSKDNVIKILILAHEHNASWLKAEALQFIKSYWRPEDLKQSEFWDDLTSYLDLTKEVFSVVLERPNLTE